MTSRTPNEQIVFDGLKVEHSMNRPRFRVGQQGDGDWYVWDNQKLMRPITNESFVLCCNIADAANGLPVDPATECAEVAQTLL